MLAPGGILVTVALVALSPRRLRIGGFDLIASYRVPAVGRVRGAGCLSPMYVYAQVAARRGEPATATAAAAAAAARDGEEAAAEHEFASGADLEGGGKHPRTVRATASDDVASDDVAPAAEALQNSPRIPPLSTDDLRELARISFLDVPALAAGSLADEALPPEALLPEVLPGCVPSSLVSASNEEASERGGGATLTRMAEGRRPGGLM